MFPLWKESFTLRHGECGRDGCEKPEVWFDWMQEAAAHSAALLGCGLNAIREEGYLWVLSRIRFHQERPVRLGETIQVETAPSGVDSLFAVRQFRMTDSEGKTAAFASTAWLLLDSRTFRPKRPGQIFPGLLKDEPPLPMFFPVPGKLLRPEKTERPLTVPLRESMIDVNQHLNNARIAGLIGDWASSRTDGPARFRDLQLNFNLSTPPGCTLTIAGTWEGNAFRAEGTGGLQGEEPALRFQAEGVLSGAH